MEEEKKAVLREVLDTVELAELLGTTSNALIQRRLKDASKAPPPFCLRPLLWRREAVFCWMKDQEQRLIELARTATPPATTPPVARSKTRARQTSSVVTRIAVTRLGKRNRGRPPNEATKAAS